MSDISAFYKADLNVPYKVQLCEATVIALGNEAKLLFIRVLRKVTKRSVFRRVP